MKDLGRDRTFSIMSQIAKIAGFRVPVVHSPFVFVFSQALKNVKATLSPWVGFGQPASLQSPSLGVHQGPLPLESPGMEWNAGSRVPAQAFVGLKNRNLQFLASSSYPGSHTPRNGRTAHNIWAPVKSFLKSWSSKGILLSLRGRPAPRVPLGTSTYRCNNQAEPSLKVLFRLGF